MKRIILLVITVFMIFSGCRGRYVPPVLEVPFSIGPSIPDYSLETSWAALPGMKDSADRVPAQSHQQDLQGWARADVFFIHPTSFLKKTEKSDGWNADIRDEEINLETDKGSILNQASIFNGAGSVYAPRYRQAFIYSYFSEDKQSGKQALDLAYADVKSAFEYYLHHYNGGRPFIIASHSQGTTHAIKLLQDYIDDKPLAGKLVAAYIVGMDVYDTLYTKLKPCSDANETGCYVTWRTYAYDYFLPGYIMPDRLPVCTNPLTWTTAGELASRELNKGGVLWKFDKVIKHVCDAQVKDGVLRIHEPRFRGRAFFNFKNYHIVDYNLFYLNVRENAINRTEKYFLKNK